MRMNVQDEARPTENGLGQSGDEPQDQGLLGLRPPVPLLGRDPTSGSQLLCNPATLVPSAEYGPGRKLVASLVLKRILVCTQNSRMTG